jgi:thioredoxin-related protein
MKYLIVLSLMFGPLLIYAQDKKGVKFEEGLSWKQVKAKAKAQNKYIFVDCYTTWCGPCKAMDINVYPNASLGNYLNKNFISVKVQMDSSKTDNDQLRGWYSDAYAIMHDYKVGAFPTFLFLNPDGNIVHRDIGYKTVDDFITLTTYAFDPQKQYYTLLEDYKNGKTTYSHMPYLAKTAQLLNDKDMALVIAKDYMANYLEKVDDSLFCTKENLGFIVKFYSLASSNSKFFNLVYNYPDKADKLMDDNGFSDRFVNYIITKEEIADKLWYEGKPVTRKPNWKKIGLTISQKYKGIYADRLLPSYKLGFYLRIKDWREFAKLREEKIKTFPPKAGEGLSADPWGLNSDAWNLFLYCDDKSILINALKWSELSIKLELNPIIYVQFYDTKANLLYKLGRVNEAIEWEEKAIELDNSNAKKSGQDIGRLSEKEYYPNLAKMKKGEPTWRVLDETKTHKQ